MVLAAKLELTEKPEKFKNSNNRFFCHRSKLTVRVEHLFPTQLLLTIRIGRTKLFLINFSRQDKIGLCLFSFFFAVKTYLYYFICATSNFVFRLIKRQGVVCITML